jgi:hypothetical protein
MYISVDVEADGKYVGDYSMVCFGAVVIQPKEKKKTFFGRTAPITDNFIPEALAISGYSREEHLAFPEPEKTMKSFADWVAKVSPKRRPTFITDNPAFDWQWINYYLHKYTGSNIFGFSARRIGDLYCGLVQDAHAPWKHLRDTHHTHHPVDDAMGNAEVVIKLQDMGLNINFKN